jgi:hypothetical protein
MQLSLNKISTQNEEFYGHKWVRSVGSTLTAALYMLYVKKYLTRKKTAKGE